MIKPLAQKNQSGMASIILALITVIVMSLIAVSTAEISRSSQTNQLNNQLGVQAYYAAETGVNDTISALKNGSSIPPFNAPCSGGNSAINKLALTSKQYLDANNSIGYTCIEATAIPNTLTLSKVDNTDVSQVVRVEPTSGTNTLVVTWGAPSANPDTNDCTFTNLQNAFPPSNNNWFGISDWNCSYPVIRMDLFEDNNSGSYNTAAQMEANTVALFLYPLSNTKFGTVLNPTINFNNPTGGRNGGQPYIIPAKCDQNSCTATLNLNGSAYTDGYARISSIYAPVAPQPVTISAPGVSGFENGQVEIDATGIDQNELKRIEVRVNLNEDPTQAPAYATDGGEGLCKRFTIGPSPPSATNATPDYNMPDSSDATNMALCGGALKPVIYLYPTHPEKVNVKLSYPTGLATTTPAYNPGEGWNVMAQPNGLLTNLVDGKAYPYLYWEGNEDSFNFNMSDGFVVPGKDSAAFLKKELPVIGLDKSEITAFMQFWLPKMEANKYTLVHFAGSDYTDMAKLTITPKPTSLLRVFMAIQAVNSPVKVTPQTFPTFHRTGFTAVEWGGTILSDPSAAGSTQ
jgi:hypothetical protein